MFDVIVTSNQYGDILSGALLLRHMGNIKEAVLIEDATREIIMENEILTPDLGGTSSTMDIARAIADRVRMLIENDSI